MEAQCTEGHAEPICRKLEKTKDASHFQTQFFFEKPLQMKNKMKKYTTDITYTVLCPKIRCSKNVLIAIFKATT